MNSYIESLPYKLEQLKDSPDTKVVLVLGNESCDLDSAVCALVLAHHQSCFSGTFALPILNIPKEDVILKVLTNKALVLTYLGYPPLSVLCSLYLILDRSQILCWKRAD